MSDAKKRKVLDQARQNVCDVVLQCYDGDIECHRDVLINGSPYFKMMFASGYGEQGKKKIRIDLDTFKKTGIVLVQYLYTGQVEDDKISLELLLEADRLNIIDLKRKCSEYFLPIINVDNCMDIAVMAEKAGAITLMDAADDFLIDITPDMTEKLSHELELNIRVLRRIFFKR